MITLTKPHVVALIGGSDDGIEFEGDASVLQVVLSLIEEANPNFAIVTP